MPEISLGDRSGAASQFNTLSNYLPGFDLMVWQGSAQILVGAQSWQLLDVLDSPLAFVASAGNPLWIASASLRIPSGITGSNGDALKLGQSLADTTFGSISSSVVAGGVLAAQAVQQAIAAPGTVGTAITASGEFRLYAHNGANAAPAGSLASSGRGARVLAQIFYYRRNPGVSSLQLSLKQQRADQGVA